MRPFKRTWYLFLVLGWWVQAESISPTAQQSAQFQEQSVPSGTHNTFNTSQETSQPVGAGIAPQPTGQPLQFAVPQQKPPSAMQQIIPALIQGFMGQQGGVAGAKPGTFPNYGSPFGYYGSPSGYFGSPAFNNLFNFNTGTNPTFNPSRDDSKTEAGFCPQCVALPSRNPARLEKIDLSKIEDSRISARSRCYNNFILASAKAEVAEKWGNRSYSGGKCARGVRGILDRAGMKKPGGIGHAIDFHGRGVLRSLGFKNIMSKNISAKNAPPGAVLVYSGPRSNQYLRNGRHDGSGTYLGHVTVKGDDGRYYTDGKTRNPAVSNRTLVGIYVMESCPQCSARVKARCERAGS